MRKNPDTATPMPDPHDAPTLLRGSKSARSVESREQRQVDLTEKRLRNLMQNVTTIKVPFALDEMTEDMHKKPLESICNDLAGKSPQCFSAKFIDKNNEVILFYFGLRHPELKERNKVRCILNSIFSLKH